MSIAYETQNRQLTVMHRNGKVKNSLPRGEVKMHDKRKSVTTMTVTNGHSPCTMVHTVCMTKLLQHMNQIAPVTSDEPVFISERPRAPPTYVPQNYKPVVTVSVPYSEQPLPYLDRTEIHRTKTLRQDQYTSSKRKLEAPRYEDSKRFRTDSLYVPVQSSPFSPSTERSAFNMIVNSVQQGAITPSSIIDNVRNQIQQQQGCFVDQSSCNQEPIVIQDDEELTAPPTDYKEFRYLVKMSKKPRKNRKVEPEDRYVTKFSLRS
jgi:hypothetical protein